MSYQPTGKRFRYNDTDYCLGISDDDLGMRTLALFYRSGPMWMATIPLIADNVRDEDIMAHGSVSAYLLSVLPKAAALLKNGNIPAKPDASDKAACVAYDLALDVDFNPDTLTFALNKTPPLSHAR